MKLRETPSYKKRPRFKILFLSFLYCSSFSIGQASSGEELDLNAPESEAEILRKQEAQHLETIARQKTTIIEQFFISSPDLLPECARFRSSLINELLKLEKKDEKYSIDKVKDHIEFIQDELSQAREKLSDQFKPLLLWCSQFPSVFIDRFLKKDEEFLSFFLKGDGAFFKEGGWLLDALDKIKKFNDQNKQKEENERLFKEIEAQNPFHILPHSAPKQIQTLNEPDGDFTGKRFLPKLEEKQNFKILNTPKPFPKEEPISIRNEPKRKKSSIIGHIPDSLLPQFTSWLNSANIAHIFDLYYKNPQIMQPDYFINYFLKYIIGNGLNQRDFFEDAFADFQNGGSSKEKINKSLLKAWEIMSKKNKIIDEVAYGAKQSFISWINSYYTNLTLKDFYQGLKSVWKSRSHFTSFFYHQYFKTDPEKVLKHLISTDKTIIKTENHYFANLFNFMNFSSHSIIESLSDTLKKKFEEWFDAKRITEPIFQIPGFPFFKDHDHFLSFFLQSLKGTSNLVKIKSYLSIVSESQLNEDNKTLSDFLDFINLYQPNYLNSEVAEKEKEEENFPLPKGITIREPYNLKESELFCPLVLNPEDITRYIQCYVKGQDAAIDNLVLPIHRYLTGIAFDQQKESKLGTVDSTQRATQKPNSLILGPTGCGKTETIRRLCELLDVPIAIVDASQIVPVGIKGFQLGDALEMLRLNAVKKKQISIDDRIVYLKKGILVLDEFDKIKNSKKGERTNGDSNLIQSQLLKVIEGDMVQTGYDSKYRLATHNVLFIAAGAFSDSFDYTKLIKIKIKNLENSGIKVELLGRFPNLVQLNPLKENHFLDIMEKSASSPLKVCQGDLTAYQLFPKFTQAAKQKLAEYALKSGTGTRGLTAVCGSITDSLIKLEKNKKIIAHHFDVDESYVELIINNKVFHYSVIEKLEEIKNKNLTKAQNDLLENFLGSEKTISDFLGSVKDHYSRLLFQAKNPQENHSFSGKEIPLLLNTPRETESTLITEKLAKNLGVPFASMNAADLLTRDSNALSETIQDLIQKADFSPKKAEQGIVHIKNIQVLISPTWDRDCIAQREKIFSNLLTQIKEKADSLQAQKNSNIGIQDEDMDIDLRSILFIFSADSYESREKEILNTDFFNRHMAPYFSNLIILEKQKKEDYEKKMEGLIEYEKRYLKDEHNIEIDLPREVENSFANWAIENDFNFEAIVNAVTRTTREVPQIVEKEKANLKSKNSVENGTSLNSGEMLQPSMLENKSSASSTLTINTELWKKYIDPQLPKKRKNPWDSMYS